MARRAIQSVAGDMLGASLYIIACSARNRTRKRLERLRQPRYLIGALVGAAYFYFSIFGPFRSGRARAGRRGEPDPAIRVGARIAAFGPALLGVVLLALSAVAWMLPFDSGLLDFSASEIQFLIPAPVSRRALLLHRMLRVQIGLLISAVITGLVFSAAGGYSRLRTSLGMWVLLFTMKMYFTGVTLVRTRLRAEPRAPGIAWAPVALVGAVTAVVAGVIARALMARPVDGLLDFVTRLQVEASTGATGVLLWPFVALSRPMFASGTIPFLRALFESLAVLAVATVWVLESDRPFQEAITDLATRRTDRATFRTPVYRTGFIRWQLKSEGRPEPAFMWKAALQTFRMVDRSSLMRLVSLAGLLVFLAVTLGRSNGFAAMLAIFALLVAMFTVVLAPQILRVDLRQDLRHLEVLKTWPVRAGAVIRGQLLWPGVFLSASTWALLGLALLLSEALPSQMFTSGLTSGGVLWAGVAAAILAPALIFMQLMIHNGVALFFPGWVSLGRQRSRGLDAMGQRLIMLGATWLALVILAVPGALAGGLLWFAFRRFIGGLALLFAAAVCAGILGIEVLLGTEALGPAYERLDVLAVERADD